MSNPYVGEIRIFAGNFAPVGWAFCDGSLMPISENTTLFQLIGTTYGGDGRTNFALPNLQGRVPIHEGPGFTQGTKGGEEGHTLTIAEMPAHTHQMRLKAAQAVSPGQTPGPTVTPAQAVATSGTVVNTVNIYGTASPDLTFAPAAIGTTGGSLAHENRQPFLTLNICIALQGIYPSRN